MLVDDGCLSDMCDGCFSDMLIEVWSSICECL
jgi:hypothetical protein